jgi:putative ABC transport system substrate-binding protein
MRRREFITLLGGAAAAWPVEASGQQERQIARIGFLTPDFDNALLVSAFPVFLAELRKLGFNEGS